MDLCTVIVLCLWLYASATMISSACKPGFAKFAWIAAMVVTIAVLVIHPSPFAAKAAQAKEPVSVQASAEKP